MAHDLWGQTRCALEVLGKLVRLSLFETHTLLALTLMEIDMVEGQKLCFSTQFFMRHNDIMVLFAWHHVASSHFMLWRSETPATPSSESHFPHWTVHPVRMRCWPQPRPIRCPLPVLVCREANGFHWSMHMHAHINTRRLQTRSDEGYWCGYGSVGCTVIWCSSIPRHRHHRDMVDFTWFITHFVWFLLCKSDAKIRTQTRVWFASDSKTAVLCR